MTREHLISDVPLADRPVPFDGFPYFISRIVPAMHHFILLPATWSTPMLIDFAEQQAAANKYISALVIGPTSCMWLDGSGKHGWSTVLPRPTLPISGALEPCIAIPPGDELAERKRRFNVLAAQGRKLGGRLPNFPIDCLRHASDDDLVTLEGRQAAGVPSGLVLCSECGQWRGDCLDPVITDTDYRPAIVTISCACGNDTLCARCLEPLARFRLNTCAWNADAKAVEFFPGFEGLEHSCAPAIQLACDFRMTEEVVQ